MKSMAEYAAQIAKANSPLETMDEHAKKIRRKQVIKDIEKVMILVLEKNPFYAQIGLDFDIQVGDKSKYGQDIQTIGTDGKHLFVNPDHWRAQPTSRKIAMLMKQISHVWLGHHLRRGERNKECWQAAADNEADHILKSENVDVDPEWACEDRFGDWYVERIFNTLWEEREEQEGGDGEPDPNGQPGQGKGQPGTKGKSQPGNSQPGNSQGQGSGEEKPDPNSGPEHESNEDGSEPGTEPGQGDKPELPNEEPQESPPEQQPQQPPPEKEDKSEPQESTGESSSGAVFDARGDAGQSMTPSEREEARDDLNNRIVMSQNAAKGMGVSGSTTTKRKVDELIKPKKSWQREINTWMKQRGRTYGRSWTKLDRRAMVNGLYQPSELKEGISWMVVGFDISGSIDMRECRAFVSHLNKIRKAIRVERMTIVPFNSYVQVDDIVELKHRDEVPDEFNINGGTAFSPVFTWIKNQHGKPDAVMIFTDMGSSDYGDPYVACPVMWASSVPIVRDGSSRGYNSSNPAPFGKTIEIELDD